MSKTRRKDALPATNAGAAAAGAARLGGCRGRTPRRRRHPDALAASAAALSAKSHRSGWCIGPNAAPERVFLAQRDAAGGWRTLTYAQTLADGARHRRGAAGARSFARAADRDSVRQRHRARAARPCRHACRHSLCADLGALFAAVAGFRQAENHHRDSHARPGLRRERHGIRARHRRGRAARVSRSW